MTMTYDGIFDNKEQIAAIQGVSKSTLSVDVCNENNLFYQSTATPKAVTPSTENVTVCTNVLQPNASARHVVENSEKKVFINRIYNEFDDKLKLNKDKSEQKKIGIYDKDIPSCSKNISNLGSDKWCTDKEKFLDSTKSIDFNRSQCPEKNLDVLKNLNIALGKTKIEKEANQLNPNQIKAGAVVIKEKYIEPPRMTRISRSFHGKSPTSNSLLDIANIPRRASDGIPLTSRNLNIRPENLKPDKNINIDMDKNRAGFRHPYLTQLSQPSGSSSRVAENKEYRKASLTENTSRNPRFTTTIVNEVEHAASVGLPITSVQQKVKNTQAGATISDSEGHASFFVGDTPLGNKNNKEKSDSESAASAENRGTSAQKDSAEKHTKHDSSMKHNK